MNKTLCTFSFILLLAVWGCSSEVKPAATGSTLQQVSVAEAKKLIDDGKVTVVDVRTPEEYKEGHIPGATSLPLQELEDRLAELDKQTPYLLVCRTGSRSAEAQKILSKNGFTNTFNMLEGMTKWTYAVER
jgi:rhodanese-related sulfurtransferase